MSTPENDARQPLGADDFAQFFDELWNPPGTLASEKRSAYLWQRRLAHTVCQKGWPDVIDLPTASGKTACLAIAVFALAAQANRPPAERKRGRRIFFVVDRRIVVDQAHREACQIKEALSGSPAGTMLRRVAEALQSLNADPSAPPLDVAILRGGLVRDNRWARSATQPTIISSTIDQVGSRLLFRGYGVSPQAKSLHAALVANDSLILLDEAHISQPFLETLEAVRRYRGAEWAHEPLRTPFDFVSLSATPSGSAEARSVFGLDDSERKEPALAKRLNCAKPARLHVAERAKGRRAIEALANELADKALEMSDEGARTVAVIVNRVATARAVHHILQQRRGLSNSPAAGAAADDSTDSVPANMNSGRAVDNPAAVHLAIGRMRPIDRDRLTKAIEAGLEDRSADAKTMFAVATQCLEVGADYDFDAMVSECASIAALRQRFGRLNRSGRAIPAPGRIVIRADQVDATDDPIYDAALSRTWHWLQQVATDGVVDFGANAMTSLLELDGANLPTMLARPPHAPVMFPAHIDAWVQTSPLPAWSPEVAPYLHGPVRDALEVFICWRQDLPERAPQGSSPEECWLDIVSLCPPTTGERMPAPIGLVRKWLTGQDVPDKEQTDLLDQAVEDETKNIRIRKVLADRVGLLWRSLRRGESILLKDTGKLRPGDTLVLPVAAGGWDSLGYIPVGAPKDIAEESFFKSTGRALVRLTPALLDDDEHWPAETAAILKGLLSEADGLPSVGDLRETFANIASIIEEKRRSPERWQAFSDRSIRLELEPYPDDNGIVVRTRSAVSKQSMQIIPALDDGNDEPSRAARSITLDDHTRNVVRQVQKDATLLPVSEYRDELVRAAFGHDSGKGDIRFQAYLMGGTVWDVAAERQLWAKHEDAPRSYREHCRATESSGRPEGFRHEMLSPQFAEGRGGPVVPCSQLELVTHLEESHHGYGDPLAPVVLDPDPPDVNCEIDGVECAISGELRRERPPHRINSGIPDRFWSLTRRLGWWGLGYLKAVLRLADQTASREEQKRVADAERVQADEKRQLPHLDSRPRVARTEAPGVLLEGLDGANPLAFLAALGVFRTLALSLPEAGVTMRWIARGGSWRPFVGFNDPVHREPLMAPARLIEHLSAALVNEFDRHPVSIVKMLSDLDERAAREIFRGAARDCRLQDRGRSSVDWLSALAAETAWGATSQLQMVRRDYFPGNLKNVIERTESNHLERCLFAVWDYGDPLDNQSLHFDPSEDRRHALQWHEPSGNPDRKTSGGMLGANRLALEALPLFQSFAVGDRLVTRGFRGTRANDVCWTWPIWQYPIHFDAVVTLLGLAELQEDWSSRDNADLRDEFIARGIAAVYRSARILVEKTPNFTPAAALL